MKDISYKGIIIALIVMFVLDTISGVALIYIFAENMSPEALEALSKTTNILIYSLLFGTLSTIVAGYIAARYAKEAPYKNALVIGVLGLVSGLFFIANYPLWFNAIGFVTVIPAALLGAYFIVRKSS